MSTPEYKSVGEETERPDIPSSSARVPESSQALLGAALLGDRLRSVEHGRSKREDGAGLSGSSPLYTECR